MNNNNLFMNIKSDGGYAWVEDINGRTILFPTKESLLEIIQKNEGSIECLDSRLEWTDQLLETLDYLHEVTDNKTAVMLALTGEINAAGIKYNEDISYIINEVAPLIKNWLCYCVTYNINRETLVDKLLDRVVLSTDKEELNNREDVVFLDKNAKEQYELFSLTGIIERLLDIKTLLYKLTSEEKEQALKELEDRDTSYLEKSMVVKGLTDMMLDMEQTLKEYKQSQEEKDIVEYKGFKMKLGTYGEGVYYFKRIDNDKLVIFDNRMDMYDKYVEVCKRYETNLGKGLIIVDELMRRTDDKNKALVIMLGIESYIVDRMTNEEFEDITRGLEHAHGALHEIYGCLVNRKIKFDNYAKYKLDKVIDEVYLCDFEDSEIYVVNEDSEKQYGFINEREVFTIDIRDFIYMLNEQDRKEAETELKRYSSGLFDIYDCKYVLKSIGEAISACKEWINETQKEDNKG